MKFIKKLFKKNGGCGETTVHLDKDIFVFKVPFSGSRTFKGVSGSGGFGGSYSSSLEINLSNLPKQIKVGNYDYNLRIDFFDDKIIAGYWNQFGPNNELTITQEKNETLSELLSRLLALVKVNINSNN